MLELKYIQMKKHHFVFILFFVTLVFLQAFFWLFANYAKPILLGMPFSMFIIVILIIAEFAGLLLLYYYDEIKNKH
jgi:hypothetical protein